jgi:hypothetical protein
LARPSSREVRLNFSPSAQYDPIKCSASSNGSAVDGDVATARVNRRVKVTQDAMIESAWRDVS